MKNILRAFFVAGALAAAVAVPTVSAQANPAMTGTAGAKSSTAQAAAGVTDISARRYYRRYGYYRPYYRPRYYRPYGYYGYRPYGYYGGYYRRPGIYLGF